MRDRLKTFSCNLNYFQVLRLSQAAIRTPFFASIIHVLQLCPPSQRLEHTIGDSDGSETSLCLRYLFTFALQASCLLALTKGVFVFPSSFLIVSRTTWTMFGLYKYCSAFYKTSELDAVFYFWRQTRTLQHGIPLSCRSPQEHRLSLTRRMCVPILNVPQL